MKPTRTIVFLVAVFALLLVFLVTGIAAADEPGQGAGGGGSGGVTIQPLEAAQAAQPDYKAMYFAALERIQELEAKFQQALDLALGYRQDWEEQRGIAEARGAQVDQTLKLADMLLAIIKDMKDTVNRQHEIIMTLTQPKKLGLQLIGGAVVHAREPTNPGVLVAVGWQF